MRRYVIDVPGDNDDLHQKALAAAVEKIQANHVGVQEAVVLAPPPGGFNPILNCTRRVK